MGLRASRRSVFFLPSAPLCVTSSPLTYLLEIALFENIRRPITPGISLKRYLEGGDLVQLEKTGRIEKLWAHYYGCSIRILTAIQIAYVNDGSG